MSQEALPTMELPKHPDLVELGKKYKEAQTRRLAALREEKVHKDAIQMKMHELDISEYHDPDEELYIELEPGQEKVKVKLGESDDDDGD